MFGFGKRGVGSKCARGAIALLAMFAATAGVHAESVYKCRDAEGHIAYQDRACSGAQNETRIELATPSRNSSSPDYGVAESRRAARTGASRGAGRRTGSVEAMSYECRADNGEVFYRHSGCPKSIPAHRDRASDGSHARGKAERGASSSAVSAIPLTRADACKRMAAAGSIGRSGRARDESVSTYDRNAGRDPCRRS
jgi:hypothetical protein